MIYIIGEDTQLVDLSYNVISNIRVIYPESKLILNLSSNELTHAGFDDVDYIHTFDYEVDSIYDATLLTLIVTDNEVREFASYLLTDTNFQLNMTLDYNPNLLLQIK